MGVHGFLSHVCSEDEILGQYSNISDFFNELISYFNDILDNSFEIYDSYINVFEEYLEKYLSDVLVIDNHILDYLNSLYQKSKKSTDKLLFIGGILNKNHYVQIYNIEKEIENLFFIKNSPACFDLVLRCKQICRFKFSDGKFLLERVYDEFKSTIGKKNKVSSFYGLIVFAMLSTEWWKNSSKINKIIGDLNDFKKMNDCNDIDKLLSSLNGLKYGLRYSSGIIESYMGPKLRFNRDSFNNNCNNNSFLLYKKDNDSLKVPITIDSGRKATRDDAFSIYRDGNNYVLTVYIADVAPDIPVSGNLFNRALRIGKTIYLPDGVDNIHLFPKEVYQKFSLDQGENRHVMAHEFVFSSDLKLQDWRLYCTDINVCNNYSYVDISKLKYKNNYDQIRCLLDLADGLIKNYRINYDIDGNRIVSALNLFTNSFMAEHFKKENYPFIYLNNYYYPKIAISNFSSVDGFIPSYSLNSDGNSVTYGLPYGKVTTPIRNLCSLLNQLAEHVCVLSDNTQNLSVDEFKYLLENLINPLNNNINSGNSLNMVLSLISKSKHN